MAIEKDEIDQYKSSLPAILTCVGLVAIIAFALRMTVAGDIGDEIDEEE